MTKSINIVDIAISIAFTALFALTPLVFNPFRILPSFELFEWSKINFVYILTIFIICATLSKMLLTGIFRIPKNPFIIPVVFYWISQAIATLFSIDPHVSFFGYYSRFHGGLLSITAYSLLFFAFIYNRKIVNPGRLLYISLLSATAVAIYAITQKYGIDASMWVQDVQNRVFSTFGQPNWLAAYLTLFLPLSFSAAFKSINFNIHKQTRGFFRYISTYSLITIILYLSLLFTKSRSGFLGFWGGFVFFAGFLWLWEKNARKTVERFLFLQVAILFVVNFFFETPFPAYNKIATISLFSSHASLTKPTPIPTNSDSIIDVGITDSADIRKIVWRGALEIVRRYPLFGTGPETFAFAYYKYRPVEHNLTSEWDFLYNRAHNEFLNIAASSGILGLSAYILFCSVFLFWILRQAKTYPRIRVQLLSFFTAAIAIHITNFFGFSVVYIGLWLFLLPALSLALVSNEITNETHQQTHRRYKKFIIPIALTIICLSSVYLTITVVRFWIADSLYARAISFSRQEQYAQSYPAIVSAVELRPNEPVYLNEKGEVAANLIPLALEIEDATKAAELTRIALDASAKAITISPQNVNFWKTRTRILYLLSNYQPEFSEEALKTILIAQELAPTDPKISYNVAVLYGRVNKNEEAISTLKKTIELKPDYRDAYVALSIFYEDSGNMPEARNILELGLRRINPDDEEFKSRLKALE